MDEDRTRFEELFNRHYGAVMRYAARRLDPEQAPDVVSETFLVAWRRLGEVPAADPLPWLYATARNVIGNELRGRSRRARLEARIGDTADLVEQDHAELVADRVRVRRALAGLSERDQEALRLAAWEGLSVDEAATVMGCSRAAYRVRLHRARKRLAAALDVQPRGERSGSALFPLVPEGGSR